MTSLTEFLLICYFPMWQQHLLAYHTLPKGDKIVLLKSPCFNVTMVSQRDAIRIEMQQQVGAASSNMMTSGSSTSELRPRQRCSTLPDPSRRFPNLHGEAGGGGSGDALLRWSLVRSLAPAPRLSKQEDALRVAHSDVPRVEDWSSW